MAKRVFILCALGLGCSLLGSEGVQAELWRSPLNDLKLVQIEKRPIDLRMEAEAAAKLPAERVFEALPTEIVSALGEHFVDYDSFVVAYLPEAAARALEKQAHERGLKALRGVDRHIHLAGRSFDPGDPKGRMSAALRAQGETGIRPVPVPGSFLVQLAFPVREEWLGALRGCGFEVLANVSPRTFLIEAPGHREILRCVGQRVVSWIDVFLTTDRVSAELLADEGAAGYTLQYPGGADVGQKAASLPPAVQLRGSYRFPDGGGVFLYVETGAAGLRELVGADRDLLAVTHTGIEVPSDERQGAIVAGRHDGARVTSPGYKSWLSGRNLLTSTHPQIVAIHDLGYDDGGAPTMAVDHHPDLEGPERLVSLTNPTGAAVLADKAGHGTMVAGIIAGDGTAGIGTGATDAQGYLHGLGIAPNVKLAVSTFVNSQGDNKIGDLTFHSSAFQTNRNNPDGTDRATVANQSWNSLRVTNTSPPQVLPLPEYTDKAKYFDDRVLDANEALAGQQPMTIVFSAGNQAWDPLTSTVRRDSVSAPATAKNVITVGATTSYRPAPDPPLDCRPTQDGARPPNQDAVHIARIGSFSGRSRHFTPTGPGYAHTVRIKPDVVAPAVRVFSTVPYGSGTPYDAGTGDSFVGCTKYWPPPPMHYHTYGTGTSFAAPVVSGVAALKRKWFQDRGVTPSPSLIKASIIATADDLGPSGLIGSDHRPSPNNGWGRVNLDRLTDSRSRFYVTDNQGLAVATGQQRIWTRTIGVASTDIYIVLVWSDPSSDITPHSQAPLKNDLGLEVTEVGSPWFWRGNNFQENVAGNDNGYSYRFGMGEISLIDSINNVEAVFIPANTFSAGQQLTIKVTGENVQTGTQRFALYAYNVQ